MTKELFHSQIQKSKAHHDSYNKSYWIPDGDVMVITAYFVHPSVICKGGRKKSSYIGEDLYIQSGPSVEDLMKIPFKESDLASTKWVKGKCFYSMGKKPAHYKVFQFCPVFL